MNTQPNQDVVGFHGVDILTFTENHEHYIAIKPLCEQFGIDWRSQHKKLNRNKLFNSTMVVTTTVGADGKQREMTCLPLEVFPMWLARINTGRVESPQAARIILEFQKEATQVLYEHFMGPRTLTPGAVRKMVRQELAKERLAEYVYVSDIWNEERIKRLSRLKETTKSLTEPLTWNELGRLFECSGTTVRKAWRLYRRAKGDFEDKRPDALKPNGTPQLSLIGPASSKPISEEDKTDIWSMRHHDGLTYDEIADLTGYSPGYCRRIARKVQLQKEGQS